MKKNIVVVSMINSLAVVIAQTVATKIGYEFVNIDSQIDEIILKNDEKIDLDTLSNVESKVLEQIVNTPSVVFYVSADVILANNNIQYLLNSDVFYLHYSERMFEQMSKNRIKKFSYSEINNFLSKNIKKTIFVDNCSNNQVISKIFDFLR